MFYAVCIHSMDMLRCIHDSLQELLLPNADWSMCGLFPALKKLTIQGPVHDDDWAADSTPAPEFYDQTAEWVVECFPQLEWLALHYDFAGSEWGDDGRDVLKLVRLEFSVPPCVCRPSRASPDRTRHFRIRFPPESTNNQTKIAPYRISHQPGFILVVIADYTPNTVQDYKFSHVIEALQDLPSLERLTVFIDLHSVRRAIHQTLDDGILYEYDTGSWYTDSLNAVVESVLPGLQDFVVLAEWPRYFRWTRATRDAAMVMEKHRIIDMEEGHSMDDGLGDGASIGSSIFDMCEENEHVPERWEWPFGLA